MCLLNKKLLKINKNLIKCCGSYVSQGIIGPIAKLCGIWSRLVQTHKVAFYEKQFLGVSVEMHKVFFKSKNLFFLSVKYPKKSCLNYVVWIGEFGLDNSILILEFQKSNVFQNEQYHQLCFLHIVLLIIEIQYIIIIIIQYILKLKQSVTLNLGLVMRIVIIWIVLKLVEQLQQQQQYSSFFAVKANLFLQIYLFILCTSFRVVSYDGQKGSVMFANQFTFCL
eukprot:TRINITY_DN7595_c0_g2_i3.p2 TRINITY_DN7595_c0_g2~~TRINITY_DN7595_c0_g2_i3.p2  ORF type:complete len:223 (+),score=-4.23 TRINITY_DN7595_c0_g2_i3:248-916(+)